VKTNKFRNEERNRLRKDIDLRHRMNSIDEIDDLALRLNDAIEQIKFDLSSSVECPLEYYDEYEVVEWRIRAQRAIAKFELVLKQIERRKELIIRMQQQKK
jgi:hypothetical protein